MLGGIEGGLAPGGGTTRPPRISQSALTQEGGPSRANSSSCYLGPDRERDGFPRAALASEIRIRELSNALRGV